MIEKVLYIILTQGVGDHLFQGPNLSKMKQDKPVYLLAHTALYSIALIPLSYFFLDFSFKIATWYFGINFILHILVDFGTGKLKKKFWKKNESAYFTVAAVDQLIHIVIMLLTYVYFATGSFDLSAIS
ncbi:MAG: DUF3307 domain-containing protein [Bacteroidales bacterium]|nr:DUF3307 domain-containing protein [Bacteroidales bacterium]